ncbi:hypothetical protein L3X38_031147 [Prunus dulcis]|uniref:Uncharacterized protein n=1 Tax=Prunus dulcis TaxID=3755 RepID=A0AAD4YUP2_PRUDU|nr:hypothetical protein L3X38_031147 [Prunus dulcis]
METLPSPAPLKLSKELIIRYSMCQILRLKKRPHAQTNPGLIILLYMGMLHSSSRAPPSSSSMFFLLVLDFVSIHNVDRLLTCRSTCGALCCFNLLALTCST